MRRSTFRRPNDGQGFLPEMPTRCATVKRVDGKFETCRNPVTQIHHCPPGLLGYCDEDAAAAQAFHQSVSSWREAYAAGRTWWVRL